MWSFHLTGSEEPTVQRVDATPPTPRRGEVLINIEAVSLNYRDVIIAQNTKGLIPLSDGAGVVAEVGDEVETVRVGDRVVIGFMPGWAEGEFSAAKQASALGGAGVNGVLTSSITVPAAGVVKIPDTMTFEQAATLPCAGVTAWSALFERRPVQPGETVLLLGTGGVSIFALQLAKLAGARVIITSSSDEKLEHARALGADHVINYRSRTDWAADVCDLTDGLGADLAIDVAGPATLNDTLKATRHGGRISLMGVLTGFAGQVDTVAILDKRITLQGIYVGPVSSLYALTRLPIAPSIDTVFETQDVNEAYARMRRAHHTGKIVVRV